MEDLGIYPLLQGWMLLAFHGSVSYGGVRKQAERVRDLFKLWDKTLD